MAPFWPEIDRNPSNGTMRGVISHERVESRYYLEQVNAYIQRQRQITFQGTWMMNVYFKAYIGSKKVSGSTLIRRWKSY